MSKLSNTSLRYKTENSEYLVSIDVYFDEQSRVIRLECYREDEDFINLFLESFYTAVEELNQFEKSSRDHIETIKRSYNDTIVRYTDCSLSYGKSYSGDKPFVIGTEKWGVYHRSSQIIMNKILLHFIKAQEKKIKITPEKNSDEFLKQLAFGSLRNNEQEAFLTEYAKQQKDLIKECINPQISLYHSLGDKFGFFAKNPDRGMLLTNLSNKIKKLLDETPSDKFDKETTMSVVHALIDTQFTVIESHKAHSVMGRLGFTNSRLAESLENALKALIKKKVLTAAELKSAKDEIYANKNKSPLI